MPEYTFSRAIDQAIAEAMERDHTIVLIGEDAPMLRAPLSRRALKSFAR